MPSSSLGDTRRDDRGARRAPTPVAIDVPAQGTTTTSSRYERLVTSLTFVLLVGAGIGVGTWLTTMR